MKQIKETVHAHASEWVPKIAFLAVFGLTGLACLGAVKVYKSLKAIRDADLVITEDDWKNGQA